MLFEKSYDKVCGLSKFVFWCWMGSSSPPVPIGGKTAITAMFHANHSSAVLPLGAVMSSLRLGTPRMGQRHHFQKLMRFILFGSVFSNIFFSGFTREKPNWFVWLMCVWLTTTRSLPWAFLWNHAVFPSSGWDGPKGGYPQPRLRLGYPCSAHWDTLY